MNDYNSTCLLFISTDRFRLFVLDKDIDWINSWGLQYHRLNQILNVNCRVVLNEPRFQKLSVIGRIVYLLFNLLTMFVKFGSEGIASKITPAVISFHFTSAAFSYRWGRKSGTWSSITSSSDINWALITANCQINARFSSA